MNFFILNSWFLIILTINTFNKEEATLLLHDLTKLQINTDVDQYKDVFKEKEEMFDKIREIFNKTNCNIISLNKLTTISITRFYAALIYLSSKILNENDVLKITDFIAKILEKNYDDNTLKLFVALLEYLQEHADETTFILCSPLKMGDIIDIIEGK